MLDPTRPALLAGALLVAGQSARGETATLEKALAKASEPASLFKAGDAAVAAARAGLGEAGIWPNPCVTLHGENFVGTGPCNVLGQTEINGTILPLVVLPASYRLINGRDNKSAHEPQLQPSAL